MVPYSSRPDRSVHCVRADCGGRLFTAKLRVVVHYLPHQMLRLVSSATVFAIASMTSSASSVSTLSEPACPIPQSWSQEPVHVGGGGRNTPGRMKRWRDRPRHTLPRDPVSACLPPTPSHRCNGFRTRSLKPRPVTDRGGRRFTAKLAVVVHDLAHQLLNHLLTDDAILLARQFCDRLRDRVDDFICFRGIDFA